MTAPDAPDTPPSPVPPVAPGTPVGTTAPAVPAAPAIPVLGAVSPWAREAAIDAPTGPVGPLPGVPPMIGRGRPDRPALGWTEIGVAAATYLVAQIVLGTAALVVNGGTLPGAPWLVALSATAAFAAVGAAIVVRVRSFAALGFRRVGSRVLLGAVGLGIVVWVGSRILIVLYVLLTGDVSDPQEELTAFTGLAASVAVTAIGGLLVPFGEELLFRGVLFGGLRRYGVPVAAGASAAVFAVAHGVNAVTVAALLLGVVNAVLYERTRSIWPAVVVHAVFNLTSFGLLLLVR